MESTRRETRIPRPAGGLGFSKPSALQPLCEQVYLPPSDLLGPLGPKLLLGHKLPTPNARPLLQENITVLQDRKRKDLSPGGKAGPTAKRAAVPATAVAAQAAVSAPAEDNIWEQVAEETGWTVADCLSHKLSFPKRADAKAKVEPLVQHVKRLRAAGWYLHDQKERCVAPDYLQMQWFLAPSVFTLWGSQ
jgi:hypothetical protein